MIVNDAPLQQLEKASPLRIPLMNGTEFKFHQRQTPHATCDKDYNKVNI